MGAFPSWNVATCGTVAVGGLPLWAGGAYGAGMSYDSQIAQSLQTIATAMLSINNHLANIENHLRQMKNR